MGLGLRALNRLAGSDLLDRIRIRKQVERALFSGTKNGFRSATAAGRTFKAAQKLGKPARQKTGKPRGLFDLSPDDEQQMFQEAVRDFAAEKVRPAAQRGRRRARRRRRSCSPRRTSSASTCSASPRSSAASCTSRRRSTSVLIGEALAHGDMGIAYAALAPGAVATAIGHWGTAEQEATYLPAFTGEDTPAAALAILEPRPLFDPLEAGDDGPPRRRGLGPRRRQVAARPGQGVRALRRRRRGRGHRPGAVRGRVGRQRPLGRGRAGDGPAARGHRPPAARRTSGCRPARCSARASPRTTSSACSARADRLVRARGRRPRRRCSTTSSPTSTSAPPSANRSPTARASPSRSPTSGSSPTAMRLATYRAASRADQGEEFAREAALARAPLRRQGDADRLRRRAAARRPRLRQGAPGRALVPRPPRSGRDGGRPARLAPRSRAKGKTMINLEIPKKFKPLVSQANQVATEVFRPISRKYDEAEHAYPKELDMLASLIDGHERGRRTSAAPAPPGCAASPRTATRRRATATAPTSRPCSASSSSAGATSACCSRCRARASATRRSPRSRPRSSSSATAASGRRWRSPSRRPARTRPRSAPPPSSTATSTCSTARRSSSPRATAPT